MVVDIGRKSDPGFVIEKSHGNDQIEFFVQFDHQFLAFVSKLILFEYRGVREACMISAKVES